jgi:hypothetical protein
MYIHPELGLRLAHETIEERRFRTQRASELRTTRLERGTPADEKPNTARRWAMMGRR